MGMMRWNWKHLSALNAYYIIISPWWQRIDIISIRIVFSQRVQTIQMIWLVCQSARFFSIAKKHPSKRFAVCILQKMSMSCIHNSYIMLLWDSRTQTHKHTYPNNRFPCLHMMCGIDSRTMTKTFNGSNISRFFFLLLSSLPSLRCYLVKRKCLYSCCGYCVALFRSDRFVLPHLILSAICVSMLTKEVTTNFPIVWHSIDFWFLLFFTRKRIYLPIAKVKPILLSIFLIVCKCASAERSIHVKTDTNF